MNQGSLLIQGITVDFPIGKFLSSLFFGLSWKWERCSGYRRETLNPDAHIPYLQPPFSPKDDHQKFSHLLVSVSFLIFIALQSSRGQQVVYDICDLIEARPELPGKWKFPVFLHSQQPECKVCAVLVAPPTPFLCHGEGEVGQGGCCFLFMPLSHRLPRNRFLSCVQSLLLGS